MEINSVIYRYFNKTLDDLGIFLLEFDPLLCISFIKNNDYKLNIDIAIKDKIIENISKDEECSAIYILDNIDNFENIPEEIISTFSKNYKSITEDWLSRIIDARNY